jgi:hypothetical protein
MGEGKNYRVVVQVDNFTMDDAGLDFGDFRIEKVKPGTEASSWKKILNSRQIPMYVLFKDFLNYFPEENDPSGFSSIMKDLMDLLIVFRLFKMGDLFFNNVTIVDNDSNQSFSSYYTMDNFSVLKYIFESQDLKRFVDFKNIMIPKMANRNNVTSFYLGKYLSGSNKGFFYKVHELNRIVDYVVALESVFMFKSDHNFISRTLAKRVSNFLDDPSAYKIIKSMYNERSKIVHGSLISLNESREKKLMSDLKKQIQGFEFIMRNTLIKLLGLEFNSTKELTNYMKCLYSLPKAVSHRMNISRQRASVLLSSLELKAEIKKSKQSLIKNIFR